MELRQLASLGEQNLRSKVPVRHKVGDSLGQPLPQLVVLYGAIVDSRREKRNQKRIHPLQYLDEIVQTVAQQSEEDAVHEVAGSEVHHEGLTLHLAKSG